MKNKLFVAAIVCIVNVSAYAQKNNLSTFLEQIKTIEVEFDAFDSDVALDDIEELLIKIEGKKARGIEIKGLLKELKESKKVTGIIQDYLTLKAKCIQFKIHELKVIKGYETKKSVDFIKSISNHIITEKNSNDDKFVFKEKFKKLSKGVLNELEKYDEADVNEIYKFINKIAPEKVDPVNASVYRYTVPENTIKLNSEYLVNTFYVKSDDSFIVPQTSREAFRNLYDLYTRDGEVNSLILFKNKMEFNNQSVKKYLFNETDFQELYTADVKIASIKAKIVNNDNQKPDDEYFKLLNTYGGKKDIDFVIIQKLIKQHLFDKSYPSAISVLEKIEDSVDLSEHVKSKINKLIVNIKSLMSNAAYSEKKLSICSEDIDENYFFFNNANRKIALVEQVNFGKIKLGDLDGNTVLRNDKYESRYYYRFEYGKLKRKNVSDLIKGESLDRDFFVSKGERIIFFVSDMSNGREDASKSNPNEYVSPWFTQNNILLQEDNIARGFNGKRYGNKNTDIYYCVYDPKKSLFTEPKLLEGVNTPYSERSPSLSADNSTLYFASEGYEGVGGYDIYKVDITLNESDKEITITTGVENFYQVNSVNDDMFFHEFGKGREFVSSNRESIGDSDFDIYELFEGEKPKEVYESGPVPEPKPESVPKNDDDRRILPLDDMDIEFDCKSSYGKVEVPDDHIIITGRITDKKGKLFERAKIVFISKLGRGYKDTVDLSMSPDSVYSVIVPHKRGYHIEAFGYSGKSAVAHSFSEGFIFVCENKNKNKFVSRNEVLESIEEKTNKPSKVPFLFETDGVDIRKLLNYKMLNEYYSNLLERLKGDKKLYLIIRGYADERGTKDYNCKLSRRRVNAVENYLLSLGYPQDRVITDPMGESIDFNEDTLENYKHFFFDPVELPTVKDVKLQLNRRVEIIYSDYENSKILKGCEH